jgi:hypothetical protein
METNETLDRIISKRFEEERIIMRDIFNKGTQKDLDFYTDFYIEATEYVESCSNLCEYPKGTPFRDIKELNKITSFKDIYKHYLTLYTANRRYEEYISKKEK